MKTRLLAAAVVALIPLAGLAAEGDKTQPATPAGQSGSFDTLDANKDGRISMPEASADPKLVESFSSADKNGDGYLDNVRVQQHQLPHRSAALSRGSVTPRGGPTPRGVGSHPVTSRRIRVYWPRRQFGGARRAWTNLSRRRFSTWRRATRRCVPSSPLPASSTTTIIRDSKSCTAPTPAGCARSSRCSAGRASRWSARKAPRRRGASRCIRSPSRPSCASAAICWMRPRRTAMCRAGSSPSSTIASASTKGRPQRYGTQLRTGAERPRAPSHRERSARQLHAHAGRLAAARADSRAGARAAAATGSRSGGARDAAELEFRRTVGLDRVRQPVGSPHLRACTRRSSRRHNAASESLSTPRVSGT